VGVFSPSGPSSIATSSSGTPPSNPIKLPDITNPFLPVAATEVTLSLPATMVQFTLRSRTRLAKLQIAYVATESGTKFVTIYPGKVYERKNIDPTAGLTLYIQSNKASTTLELETWT
jgi:hypothetical protein